MTWLDELLNQNTKTAAAEQAERTQWFVKAAAENGYDLNKMSNEQIAQLWTATFDKSAESDEEKKKREEAEKAKKDEAEKKAQAEKVAAAQEFGEMIAHFVVQGLQKVANEPSEAEMHKAVGTQRAAAGPHASGGAMHGMDAGEAHMRSEVAKANTSKAKDAVAWAKSKIPESLRMAAEKHPNVAKGLGAGAVATGLAAAGYAGYRHLKNKNKGEEPKNDVEKKEEEKAAAFITDLNGLGVLCGMKLAELNGFDPDEAYARMIGTLSLNGATDYSKTAAVDGGDQDTLIYTRSLELLDAAGYRINW